MPYASASLSGHAAVLVVLGSDGILLTRRSVHMTSHSAEVALPGGKWEEGDASLLATALRETHEEVGLAAEDLRITRSLPPAFTGSGVRVQPFVAHLVSDARACVNSRELDAVFWVPESFLLRDRRIRTDVFTVAGQQFWSPAYRFGEYEIWGFTARVLVDFLALVRGQRLPMANPAPVARHKPGPKLKK